jgi:GT2 family glycosyltransferase
MPKFSIIIPVKSINDYVRESVPYVQALSAHSWELLIIPNNRETNEWPKDKRISIIDSGRVGPADKRDLGAKKASGDILVFLDDDSYPEPDILEVADSYFNNSDVVAIGGPAITPPTNSFWQKVSGAVFLSIFSGGLPERYIPFGKVKEVEDWPSVNLMVRKKDFLAVGGFNSTFWPGEDTLLCLNLIQNTRKKILYIPHLKVWHHRRSGLFAHIKQVGAYGMHRGFFVKKYPKTSRKIIYFLPSAFLLFFIFTLIILLFFNYRLDYIILLKTGWIFYIMAMLKVFYDVNRHETIMISVTSVIYTFLTHLTYGAMFIKGLLIKNIKSKLR